MNKLLILGLSLLSGLGGLPLDHAHGADLKNYRAVLESCENNSRQQSLALRRWVQNEKEFLFLVQPQTLETQKVMQEGWDCQPVEWTEILSAKHRYGMLLRAQWENPSPLDNAGLRRPSRQNQGSFLTIDLCPSGKPMDRDFFRELNDISTEKLILNLAVSGKWMESHGDDWQWIQDKKKKGLLQIHWINHSYSHPYVRGVPNDQNFLLRPGVDFDREVLVTEKMLLERGETPSVFFRFPGLVAKPHLMERLTRYGLIAVGADAWIAKGQKPKEGSIILLHGNGNERHGLFQFMELLTASRIPLPFFPILDFN